MSIDKEIIIEKIAQETVNTTSDVVTRLNGNEADVETVLRRALEIAQTMGIMDCSNCPFKDTCVTPQQLEEDNPSVYDLQSL